MDYGSIYMSKTNKDKVKNMNLDCYWNDVIAEFKGTRLKKGITEGNCKENVEGKAWFW